MRVWVVASTQRRRAFYRLEELSSLGFPGCIGSVDCASWFWYLWTTGLQWKCSSKKVSKPNVRMEAVCDDYLRVWFLILGALGSRNYCQIFSKSTLFNKIRTVEGPNSHSDMRLTDWFVLTWVYFLVDGIHPKLRFLMYKIGSPSMRNENIFCRQQEGARKMIESMFGVMFMK